MQQRVDRIGIERLSVLDADQKVVVDLALAAHVDERFLDQVMDLLVAIAGAEGDAQLQEALRRQAAA